MRKLVILLFVFAPQINALEVIRANAGYMFRFDGLCWYLPEYVDISKFPTVWTKIEDAQAQNNWPSADSVTQALCDSWKVSPWSGNKPRPVYSINGFPATKTRIGEATIGTPCGEHVSNYSNSTSLDYRLVTINTLTGVSVCTNK